MRRLTVLLLLLSSAFVARAEVPVTLKGSPASIERQHALAVAAGYPFVVDGKEIGELVEAEALVELTGNRDYALHEGVSSVVARPEMRLFIERLAAQYRKATGERLVVTSLTRPKSKQPRNSHPLSVHPAGIAVDLRISQHPGAREWLESALLALEERGVLDVTRERMPPHYHVALFPEAYAAHVESVIGTEALAAALLSGSLLDDVLAGPAEEPAPGAEAEPVSVPEQAERLAAVTASPSSSGGDPDHRPFLLLLAAAVLAVVQWSRQGEPASSDRTEA